MSVDNDFPIGPEVLVYDCFTPGLWLSVGDGSFLESWTVEKWPFLNLKLLYKSEGLDQKKKIGWVGVKMTEMVRVMTNSKDGSPWRESILRWKKNLAEDPRKVLIFIAVNSYSCRGVYNRTLLFLIWFVLFGLGYGF